MLTSENSFTLNVFKKRKKNEKEYRELVLGLANDYLERFDNRKRLNKFMEQQCILDNIFSRSEQFIEGKTIILRAMEDLGANNRL